MAVFLFAIPGHAAAAVLHDQTDAQGALAHQSYEDTSQPQLTSQIADDFTVPAGETWSINEVDVQGNQTGSTPMNVVIYANAGTTPGAQVFSQSQIAAPGTSDYAIPLSGVPSLAPGTYWVSVQGHGVSASTWYWDDRTIKSGNPAVSRNPGMGITTACPDWVVRDTCYGPGNAPDERFALLGTAVATPSNPSNAFSFGSLKKNKKKGTATLVVQVPGPGTLSLRGDGIKGQRRFREARASKAIGVAGAVTVVIKSKGPARFKLNRTGKVKLRAKLTFTPTGGAPNTQTKVVKLVKKR